MNPPIIPDYRSFFFLYGPSGSGKTTMGQILANQLNQPFVDLDTEIEKGAGRSIPEIFSVHGEAHFRALEQKILMETLTTGKGVVSLGGGTLVDPQNRRMVEGIGTVLCLYAPLEVLLDRLADSQDERPLLAGDTAERLQALLETRGDHYSSFSRQLDVSSLTPQESAWEAQVLLGAFFVRGMGAGYDVRVLPGLLDQLGDALRARQLRNPICVVSDENVAPLYSEKVRFTLEKAGFQVHLSTLPAGENHKNIATVSRLWEDFLQAKMERGSLIVALGGGVIGDLAGFAAATYLRGVPWVVAPTSLLAMVDASLGGKTGVNLPQGKNLVGAFYPPRLVQVDPTTLDTLPEVELRAGFAEVVKHGVIGDPTLFEICSSGWEAVQSSLDMIVRRSMAVKIRIIQEDPFEGGRRAALNLGHTIGHAVEAISGYRLRHGEAIAIGLVAEALLAEKLGIAEKGLTEIMVRTLHGLGLPTELSPHLDMDQMIQAMSVDKKRALGEVRFSLPKGVGEVLIGVKTNEKDVRHILGRSYARDTSPSRS